jgi:hypothetical protein
MISKYQFMEVNTQRRGQGLREKIPDIQKTLETVRFLGKRRKVRTFSLLFLPSEVMLWEGRELTRTNEGRDRGSFTDDVRTE